MYKLCSTPTQIDTTSSTMSLTVRVILFFLDYYDDNDYDNFLLFRFHLSWWIRNMNDDDEEEEQEVEKKKVFGLESI